MQNNLYLKQITNLISEKTDEKKPAQKNEDESDNQFDYLAQDLIINVMLNYKSSKVRFEIILQTEKIQ